MEVLSKCQHTYLFVEVSAFEKREHGNMHWGVWWDFKRRLRPPVLKQIFFRLETKGRYFLCVKEGEIDWLDVPVECLKSREGLPGDFTDYDHY